MWLVKYIITFVKGGLRGIYPTWRPPSERATEDEIGKHLQTETLRAGETGCAMQHLRETQ